MPETKLIQELNLRNIAKELENSSIAGEYVNHTGQRESMYDGRASNAVTGRSGH